MSQIPPGGPVPRTPLLANIYRKGLVSMVAGIGLVAYGAIASAHIVLLIGLVVIVWGVVRFRGFRSRAGQ